jgi:mono/diheme cytochrome c family protein
MCTTPDTACRLFTGLRLLALAGLTLAPTARAGDPPRVDFARDIWPIFQRSCAECHGPTKQKGKLRLDSREAVLTGGASGPAVVPGKPDVSELVRRVTLPNGAEDRMPARGEPLSTSAIDRLRAWIEQGAPWSDDVKAARHWAYVKPTRPPLPQIRYPILEIRNPVDALVRAKLRAAGLEPSPEAYRYTLIRRVSLDLTGLPPSPQEVDAFLADPRPDAYERLVDRLLASPQFGERWARPWLDLARYADSHGFQRDDLREIWAYRDWVIRALNADMPFDRFTVEQIAGDLLPNATHNQRIATGFHRCCTTNVEAGSDPEETRVNQVIDRVNTTAAVWLGSTLECAQCHDHKYDPFTQRDYYRLFAVFNGTEKEADRARANVPGSIQFLGPRMELAGVGKVEPLGPTDPVVDDADGAAKAKKPAAPAAPRAPTTLVMKELSRPRETRVFLRGDFRSPGERVSPGAPAVLSPLKMTPVAHAPGSPNRLDLARWLVSPENPLSARVTVNRWWAELFGRGLVATPEDFGLRGEPPTHPDLLDWLACEFMDSGWSMKHLLRTIVTTGTYRQSSRVTPDLLARDPDNKLLARGPRFRLDAEAVRDNALALAGLLSYKAFGPPVMPPQQDGVWGKVGGAPVKYTVSPGEDRYRRGIYVVWKRATPYPSFAAFDATARLTCTVKRARTNTPLQALTLLNDPVYIEAALALAKRAVTEAPAARADDRIRHAFRLCLARPPRESEVRILRELFDRQLESARQAPDKAKTLIGTFTRPDECSAEEFVAWYSVAAALLNLDETITKE